MSGYFGSPTKGHVIQRMRNIKLPWSVMYSQKAVLYDIASISEATTPIDKKFQDYIWTTKMCPADAVL